MATPLYVPAWWIPGPHLHTLWGKFFRRTPRVPVHPIQWETPDGDFLDLWRVNAEKGRPRILLLHGLEGGLGSHYVGGLFAEARRRGWGADLLVFRSCGAELNRNPRFYHSGETTDLAFVLERLLVDFPDSAFVLAGVSLGGNVLLKFLGEQGDALSSRIRAAAAVSVPYDLSRASRHINRGFSRIYQASFLRSLQRKVALKYAAFPDRLPAASLERAATLYAFDDRVTAPLHGFADAEDYYSQSSAIRWLSGVRIPTLLLSAIDDPFLPAEVLTEVQAIAATNPWLHAEFVERGGHAGFVGGRIPWRPVYYLERRLGEFLALHLERNGTLTASTRRDETATG